jgi:hypothetical protein
MTDVTRLRASVIGLIGLAAAQEQQVLAAPADPEPGSPDRWAAVPLVAHNTEFRRQQVRRLTAVERGTAPPEFAEPDHRSARLYASLAARPASSVRRDSWRTAGQLITGVATVSAADLLDPARNPWLRGRQLWLQIVVRGFWHPAGHLGEYCQLHGQPDRAIALAEQGVAAATLLEAPDMARGMAAYNLACAQAGGGLLDEAAATVTAAVGLNPDLRANAGRDPDLAGLRASGRIAGLVLAGLT